MAPDNTDDNKDDNQLPSMDTTPLSLQPEPGATETSMPVPGDIIEAGHDTNVPRADSPESLDEDLSTGTDRERIDPDHSIVRPALETIDKEQNGAN